MKKIFILVMALMVVGCQESNKETPISNYHKVASGSLYEIYCIRGVEYILVGHGTQQKPITPLLKSNGTISTCLDEQSLIEYIEDMEYHNE